MGSLHPIEDFKTWQDKALNNLVHKIKTAYHYTYQKASMPFSVFYKNVDFWSNLQNFIAW